MSPLSKKLKLQAKTVNDELEAYQKKIKQIRESEQIPDEDLSSCQDDKSIRKYVREQIRLSERRINNQLDRIEQKLNRLLEEKMLPPDDNEQSLEEEHLVDWCDQEQAEPRDSELDLRELNSRLFPISDETTFDWFFDRLRDDEYRSALIQRRWTLTRNVSQKSFNISVKDFLRMHFELPVCVIYSTSGYGAHGSRKKKLDTNVLTVYVTECFNRSQPGIHSFQEVQKAIVQFWGRAPDSLHKISMRAIKRNYNE